MDVGIQLDNSDARVLIYAGDVDYICNWIGNKHWALDFEWHGKAAFNAAPDNQWLLPNNSTEAGKIRCADKLCFLQVHQAGHMVPMDRPGCLGYGPPIRQLLWTILLP